MQVVSLSKEHSAEAAAMLARAFHNQPFGIFYAPDAGERMQLLQEQFVRLVRYCCIHGEPYTTAGRVEGVALWMPPGSRMTAEQEQEFGFDQLPAIFGPDAFSRYRPVRDCLNAIHEGEVKEPHWYLPILGVEPAQQGSGVGSALLRPVLARATAEGLSCYLDTLQARNVPFYYKHGFEVLVEGVEPTSGLQYWCFRRPPGAL